MKDNNKTNLEEQVFNIVKNILSERKWLADQKFFYAGPQDSRNRALCAALVNKIVTARQLSRIVNKNGNSVIDWAGGYKCRHKLIPVSDEDIENLEKKFNTRIPRATEADLNKFRKKI